MALLGQCVHRLRAETGEEYIGKEVNTVAIPKLVVVVRCALKEGDSRQYVGRVGV